MGAWGNLPPLEDGVGDFPPTLEDTQALSRLLTWIRISLPGAPQGVSSSPSLTASFSWAGINAARVTQRVQVIAEPLGTGTGEPDQTFTLINTPVILETVQLAVNGELWTRIDDLLAAPPEVPVNDPTLPPGSVPPPGQSTDPNVFAGDRESGQIQFGTGLKGARPPAGSQIVASYAYGGGRAGNVGIGSIQNSPQLPAGFKVTNPLPTWGGDEGESPTDAERNIPLYLKTGQRAVSADDFVFIVEQTPGINLGRVEVLPVTDPGVVTLLVIPVDPQNPQGPTPNRLFLDAICNYLEPRRLLTTEVIVEGPTYIGLSVSIGFDAMPGRDIATVREAVKQAIRDFLSPLTGGPNAPNGTGWPLSKNVESVDLLVQAVRVDGVSRVRGVSMWDSSGAPQTTIEISGLELPRLDQVGANAGDPEDLTKQPAQPAQKRVAVPVIPPQC
jgi:predicted phage baseplate assembly protein